MTVHSELLTYEIVCFPEHDDVAEYEQLPVMDI